MSELSMLIRPFAFVLVAMTLAAPAGANEERTRAAVEAASAWLALVDSGKAAEAYAAAGADFRSTVSADAWIEAVDGRAAELGRLQTRQPTKINYFPAPGEAESGDWVMIRFVSAFTERGQVSETVTVIRYPEDWGVSGYYVR
jgi:hypothetical protein